MSETSGRRALAKEVADEDVVLAEAQLADQLDPVERVDLGVQVAGTDATRAE